MNRPSFAASFLLPFLLLTAVAAHAQAPRPAQPPRPRPRPAVAAAPVSGAAPASAAAAAPSDASIDARANALTANMKANLGLTPAQTEKVRLINHRAVQTVELARARFRANPARLKGVVDDASAGRLAALKDVLLPAQFDKYQRKREEKMGLPNTQGTQGNAAPGLGGGGGGE